MSALAGIWRFNDRQRPDADCARMLAAQLIYGPHDGYRWCHGSLAMGRQLFRTIPEDTYDRQPLHSRDRRLTLVADVRLDNREELTAQLGLVPAEATQLCDAAILLQGLDRWGEGALTRLVGDFAFVLWDAPAQRLLLARDFLGQRPLHYHRGRGFFAFASMPKGLHALSEIPYGPDEQLVAEWLVFMPRSGPRSFFKEIARVEPGHVVTVTRDGVSSRRYWQPQPPSGNRLRSGDYVDGLRHHLDQAVQARLRGGKGTIGSHLSAGLDSSAVTATAARLLAPSEGKIVAFSAVPRLGYDGPNVKRGFADEGPLAAATAALYPNIEHVLIHSGNHASLFDELDRSFYVSQRPFVAPCLRVRFAAIDQAARERKITVMLVAFKGNITASYNGVDLLAELLLTGRFTKLWRTGRLLVQNAGMSPRGVLIRTFGAFMPARLWQWVQRRTHGDAPDALSLSAISTNCLVERDLPTIARQRNFDFAFRPWKNGFAKRLWMMRNFEFADLYKGVLGGWGVDYRDPFTDKRLVEYCLSVPTDEYLFNGVPRALARRAFSDRLPAVVLNERKFGYQGADWHEDLTAARAEIAGELDRLSACTPTARILDLDRLKGLIENWPTTGWERDDIIDQYRGALLHAITAGHFLRKTLGVN